MRQERVTKRPVRRRTGGGGAPDRVAPPATRPESAERTLKKTDELLRRLDRLVGRAE